MSRPCFATASPGLTCSPVTSSLMTMTFALRHRIRAAAVAAVVKVSQASVTSDEGWDRSKEEGIKNLR